MKATKKPVTIECFKYDGDLKNSNGEYYVPQWAMEAEKNGVIFFEGPEMYIKTLEGNHHASVGDYIIRGVNGELYPCKPDIFEKTYDIIDESRGIIKVRAEVRYFEDGEVNGANDITYEAQEQGVKPLVPCVERNEGENLKACDMWSWCLDIDPETGVILNWPKGNTAHVHYKVCDRCHIDYIVNGKKVCDNEKNGYVPNFLCPTDEGFGDYMIMDIDSEGKIAGWNKVAFENWVKTMTE